MGAGLAGLAAAAAARDAGADVAVFERTSAPGGTTVLSAGWVWRYSSQRLWRRHAPHGDRGIQQLVHAGLPDALRWAGARNVRLLTSETPSPHTEGARIDPEQAVAALMRAVGVGGLHLAATVIGARPSGGDDGRITLQLQRRRPSMLPQPGPELVDVDAVVFCGGGYVADHDRIAAEAAVDVAATRHWGDRSGGESDGTSLAAAGALGAERGPITGECYARAVPAGISLRGTDQFLAAQPHGEHAVLVDANAAVVPRQSHDWADAMRAWNLAARTGRGWYVFSAEALDQPMAHGTARGAVATAERLGCDVRWYGAPGEAVDELAEELGRPLDAQGTAAARTARAAMPVRAGLTHTRCGLRVDGDARLQNSRGPVAVRAFAAGLDVASTGMGGYASGLAQALVLGRIAGARAAAACFVKQRTP